MNGYKVLEQALALMGVYSISQEVKKAGLLIINSICEDLKISGITSLDAKLHCGNQKEFIALAYGVAMQLSLTMSDDYLKNTFEDLYTKKRNEIKSGISFVKDNAFKGEM